MRKNLPAPLRMILAALLCVAGAAAAVNTFADAEFSDGGMRYAASIWLFVKGETRLSLPPLGTAYARTHWAPVRLQLELRGVTPVLLHEMGDGRDLRAAVLAGTEERARRAALGTALLAVMLAGLGGAAALAVLRRARLRLLPALGAFALGAASCAALLGAAYAGYDLDRLRQPRYEGVLASAPWIMSVLTESLAGLDRLGSAFEAMAENLPRLLEQGETGAPMSEPGDDLRVLHVSDIHNNRAAFGLIKSLVRNFEVDLVIDTGDLTDYGSTFESGVYAEIGGLGVPYVFVSGNHDSPAIVQALKELGNVRIAGGEPIEIRGLRILAAPDPSSREPLSAIAGGDELRLAAERLFALWRGMKDKPDLVAAHNPALLGGLIGKAPVLLHGHDHRASLREIRGSLLEDAGTTGAAGLRGLASGEDVPYTVMLQYWRRGSGERPALLAVDAVTVDGLNGRLQVARTIPARAPATETAAAGRGAGA